MTQNPFASPGAPIATDAQTSWSAPFESIWDLIGRSISFYMANLPLIAGLTLPVMAPVQLVKHLLITETADPLTLVRVEMIIEAVFGTLVAAALVRAFVVKVDEQRTVGIAEGLSLGLQRWGSVFGARFISGLFMGLGLIALVIPGIVLGVRYSFTDEVAALENGTASDALSRSKALVSGRGWQIFGLGLVVGVTMLVMMGILGFVGGMFGVKAASVAFDCVGEVVYRFLTVVYFLGYLSLTRAERLGAPR